VAEGDGPVNALDSALRMALVKFYPELKRVALTDYKVRILDRGLPAADPRNRGPAAVKDSSVESGTGAKTRVLIESSDGKAAWGTVGVSYNIIDASLQALVDSMEYALLRRK
jgi:2-isopropylmalate synthase